jgi:transcriptional regulator with XRE-family HTH domain
MARRGKSIGQDERLVAFSQRLNRAMLAKGWTGAELAREASKFAPKGVEIGRHLVSAHSRGANEPTDANLSYIAKALGMKPEELLPPLPGEGESAQYATATSTLDGKTRLVVDAEVDAEIALKILGMVRANLGETKKRNAA